MSRRPETFTKPDRKETTMPLLNRLAGLHLLAALTAALLLVPAASALAAEEGSPAIFSGAGEGSGWIKGEVGSEGGVPHLECHWNGAEGKFDVGTSEATGESGEPGLEECTTRAQYVGIGNGGGILVYVESDSGSTVSAVELDESSGLVTSTTGCNSPAKNDPESCGALSFAEAIPIEITATFDSSGVSLAIDSTVGTGSGQVNCQVVGGSLDTPCEESYPEGTELELIAEAHEGSTFVAFENGTNDAEGCTTSPCAPFPLEEESEVDANFELEDRELEIEEPGSGSGTTTVECDGGSCPSLTEIPYGTMVKVSASADSGSELGALSGTGSAEGGCSAGACEFELTENSKVVVSYDLEDRELEIEEPGSGSGTTTVECDGGSCPSLTEISYGTMVKVTASADLGSELTLSGTGSAEGGCSAGACEFELTENSKVVVSYDLEEFSLTIDEPASGSGTVSCTDEGSPASCAGPFLYGHAIEVDAVAGSNNELTALTGAGSAEGKCTLENTTEGSCAFTIDEDSEVSVSFEVEPGLVTLNTTTTGTGSGEITCDGGACESSYHEGDVVELQAVPSGGHSLFKGWTVTGSGSVGTPCTGTTNPCEVEMEAPGPLSATAEFGAIAISGVTPDEGPTSGGQLVTITGENLGGASEVKFGASGVGCPSAACTIESGAEIKVETPAHAAGPVDVVVETPAGSSEGGTAAYTYVAAPTISSVSPDEGPASGGQTVTIEGTNLENVSAVEFGGSAGTGLTEVSAGKIEIDTPAHAAGAVDVKVTTPGGTATSAAAYTYLTPEKALAVGQSGTGSGSFQCDTGSGPVSCASHYPTGTTVTVIALPAANSDFTSWSGECDAVVSGNRCEVTLDADKTVEAAFTLKSLALNVAKSGTGTGTVSSEPSGIDCGATCSHAYVYGTTVTMTASPGAISDFSGWSGCDEALGDWCKVSLSAARTVTATFTQRTKALTLETVGPGSGSVSCDGGPCASHYPEGATVTLHANPDSGSSFFGWAGAGCTGAGDCVVTLDRDTTVAASFEVATSESEGGEEGKPGPGMAFPLASGLLRGKLALVKARCRGAGSCLGKVRLVVRLRIRRVVHRHGRRHVIRRTRNVVIGAGRVRIARGKTGWVKVHLNRRGLRLARRAGRRGLVAILAGKGVKNRPVRLRPRHRGRAR
jgi:hypothetical protein